MGVHLRRNRLPVAGNGFQPCEASKGVRALHRGPDRKGLQLFFVQPEDAIKTTLEIAAPAQAKVKVTAAPEAQAPQAQANRATQAVSQATLTALIANPQAC